MLKAAEKDDRPNIVVIIADDLGWNDVSYHGVPIPTPNIDRFVSEGVELNRFYVCPVCRKARLGRSPTRTTLRSMTLILNDPVPATTTGPA